MRKQILSWLAMLAVAFTLAAPAAVAQTGGQSGATPAAAGKMNRQGNERHPAIRNAIRALKRAKADMQHANHDFGGHREDALEACDNAIKQLQLALQYDKK